MSRSLKTAADVTLEFPDGVLELKNNTQLHKFDVLAAMEDPCDTGIPLAKGTVGLMVDLLHLCETRMYKRWPVDLLGMQELADYLCCSPAVDRVLSTDSPASPTAWFCDIAGIDGGEWLRSHFYEGGLVDIIGLGDDGSIEYEPLEKDEKWLFPKYSAIDIHPGTPMVRGDMVEYIDESVPKVVLDLLKTHPSMVLAGSSVLDIACPHLMQPPTDYDMYVCGVDEAEFRQIIRGITSDKKELSQTGAALTFVEEKTTIQIILRRYRDAAHVLESFDISPCKILLFYNEDGMPRVMAAKEWVHSIRHMAFWVNFHEWSAASVSRVFKYYSKGFEVFVPGMRRGRFKTDLFEDKVPGVYNIAKIESKIVQGRSNYRTWLHGSWVQNQVTTRLRPDYLHRIVRIYNYWGTRHQSGYEEWVGARLPYIVRSSISKGRQWLGLRPLRFKGPPFDIDMCPIKEATQGCFHRESPNFTGLYVFSS